MSHSPAEITVAQKIKINKINFIILMSDNARDSGMFYKRKLFDRLLKNYRPDQKNHRRTA